MIEILKDVPAGIVAVRASGTLTREEYDEVVVPLLDEAQREGRRLRCLCEVGADYRGLTPAAAWEDLTLGLRSLHLFEGCAVVSDVPWIRETSRLARFLMPCPVRVFDEKDREEAATWLAGLPEGPRASVRLIPGSGVVVLDVAAPLRAADVEALAATVDSWLATHDVLPGLVVHARGVPGWENLGTLLRHVRFVRRHHRTVRRVALAVDGAPAHLAPAMAGHFVKAELRHFGYDGLGEAITWAGKAPRGTP